MEVMLRILKIQNSADFFGLMPVVGLIVVLPPTRRRPAAHNWAQRRKLTFPNRDGLAAGSDATLYRFDQTPGNETLGQFVAAGNASTDNGATWSEVNTGLTVGRSFGSAGGQRREGIYRDARGRGVRFATGIRETAEDAEIADRNGERNASSSCGDLSGSSSR
jgi:hypothetical protein